MAVPLRDGDRTVSGNASQREGVAPSFSEAGQCGMPKTIRLKALQASSNHTNVLLNLRNVQSRALRDIFFQRSFTGWVLECFCRCFQSLQSGNVLVLGAAFLKMAGR